MAGRHGPFWSALYAELRLWRTGWFGKLFWHAFAVFLLLQALHPPLFAGAWKVWTAGVTPGSGEPAWWEYPPLQRIGLVNLAAFGFAAFCFALHPLRGFWSMEMSLPQAERLHYMLGLDTSAWVRFCRRTWWLSPLLLLGVVLTLTLGPTVDRLGVLAVAAAALLGRVGWREHPLAGWRPGHPRSLAWISGVLGFAGVCYLAGPGIDLLFAAGVAFALLVCLFTPLGMRHRLLSMGYVLLGGGLPYAAYQLISRVPLWLSPLWAAAGIVGLIGLLGMVDQYRTCAEDSLRERVRRHDSLGMATPGSLRTAGGPGPARRQ
jgi:hypothetical protein